MNHFNGQGYSGMDHKLWVIQSLIIGDLIDICKMGNLTIKHNIPPMLAYIPAPWILWGIKRVTMGICHGDLFDGYNGHREA